MQEGTNYSQEYSRGTFKVNGTVPIVERGGQRKHGLTSEYSVFLGSFRLGSQVCPGSQLNHGRRETVGRRYETDVKRFRHELNECFPTKTQLGYEAMVGEMKINTRIKRSCSKRFRFSFLPPRGKPIFFFHFPFPRSFPQPVCLLNPFLEE